MSGSEWFGSRPGGLNRYFQSLYEALEAAENIEVSASAFGNAPVGDANAHTWGSTGLGMRARIGASDSHSGVDAPSILDRHFALYGPTLRSYAHRPRHVIHFQGPWAQESRLAGGSRLSAQLKKSAEKLRYRTGDHFVVLSESFRGVLVDDYGVDDTDISTIPAGVDLDRFEMLPESAEGRQIVLCVRRLEKRMGIHVLIEAWSDVARQFPDAELQIVGTGTYEEELRRLAAVHGRGKIVFRGRLGDQDLVDAYRESAFSVVPSIALEGFGLIALESLAVGRAPIVTDCGGLPSIVSGLDPTLIVPAGSVEALSARVVGGLSGLLPGIEECRAHAEKFSWNKVADDHLALYEELTS